LQASLQVKIRFRPATGGAHLRPFQVLLGALAPRTKEKSLLAEALFFGRRTDPSNEPTLQSLHSLLLNFSGIKKRLEHLQLLISDGSFSERASKMQFLL